MLYQEDNPVTKARVRELFVGDKKGIICALAEVVWVGQEQDDGLQQIGLRFLNIMEEDQDRIDVVVKQLLERLGKTGEE